MRHRKRQGQTQKLKRGSDVLLAVKRLRERSDVKWLGWLKNEDFKVFIEDSMEELEPVPGNEGPPYGFQLDQKETVAETVCSYLCERLCQCNMDRAEERSPKQPLVPFPEDLWNAFTTAVVEEYLHPSKDPAGDLESSSGSDHNGQGSGGGGGGGSGSGYSDGVVTGSGSDGSDVQQVRNGASTARRALVDDDAIPSSAPQRNGTSQATIAMKPAADERNGGVPVVDGERKVNPYRTAAEAAKEAGEGKGDALSADSIGSGTGSRHSNASSGDESESNDLKKIFNELRSGDKTLWDEAQESATRKNSKVNILLATYKDYAKTRQHVYFVQGTLYGAALFLLVPGGIACVVLGAANPKFLGGSSHAVALFASGAAILVVAALVALTAFHLGYKRARKSEAGLTYTAALEKLQRQRAGTRSESSDSMTSGGDSGERRVGAADLVDRPPMAAKLSGDGEGSKDSGGSERKEEKRKRKLSVGLMLACNLHPYAKHRSYVVSGFLYGGGIAFLLATSATSLTLANVTSKSSVFASTSGKELLYGAAALMFLGAAFLLWKAFSKGSEAKDADRSCYKEKLVQQTEAADPNPLHVAIEEVSSWR